MAGRNDGISMGHGKDHSSGSVDVLYHLKETAVAVPSRSLEDPHVHSASGLSFSDSSNESLRDFASLLGEALVSKETGTSITGSTTFDHHDAEKTSPQRSLEPPQNSALEIPLPSALPQYRPTSPPVDLLSDMSMPPLGNNRTSHGRPPSPRSIPKSRDTSPIRNTSSNSTGALLDSFVGRVIGPHPSSEFMDIIACPCCQQCFDDRTYLSTESPLIDPHSHTYTEHEQQRPRISMRLADTSRGLSLLSAAESDPEDDEPPKEQLQIDHDRSMGVLAEGVRYRILRVIVEGLLYKKGSGQDWLGSRGLKPRWTRLVVGRIEGYGDVPVPMLCISWYPSSTSNSTVIVLDSAVVLAIDLSKSETVTQYRFEIRHASASRRNVSLPMTRTFSAESRAARDTWVYEISQALLSYEKEKAALKKSAPFKRTSSLVTRSMSPSGPAKAPGSITDSCNSGPPASRSFDEVWMENRFVAGSIQSENAQRPSSPPGAARHVSPPLSPTNNTTGSPSRRMQQATSATNNTTTAANGMANGSTATTAAATLRQSLKLAMRATSA
jgi:hypothetical protein